MSSILNGILAHFETKIEAAVPTIRKSRYYYNIDKTDDANNSHIYAVRPGSADVVTGTIQSVTIEQEIEVEVSKEYVEKGSTDSSIRAAVETIMVDHEAIVNLVGYTKPAGVTIIKHPSYSAPEVDEQRKTVSIIFTYPVTYRKSITGS